VKSCAALKNRSSFCLAIFLPDGYITTAHLSP